METTANFSVFVVDDDKMFLTSLAHHIKGMFISSPNIKTFPTGEECLKNLHTKPNVVILDYFLNSQYPEAMNGVNVLKKIKEINPDTEVIMLSAQDKMEVAIDVMKHGAADYVIKNDNVFMGIQHGIMNVIHSINKSKEQKDYKFWMQIFIAVISTIITVIICLRIFVPRLF